MSFFKIPKKRNDSNQKFVLPPGRRLLWPRASPSRQALFLHSETLPPDNTPAATALIAPPPPVRQLFTRLTYSGDLTAVVEPAYFTQRLREQMLPLFLYWGWKQSFQKIWIRTESRTRLSGQRERRGRQETKKRISSIHKMISVCIWSQSGWSLNYKWPGLDQRLALYPKNCGLIWSWDEKNAKQVTTRQVTWKNKLRMGIWESSASSCVSLPSLTRFLCAGSQANSSAGQVGLSWGQSKYPFRRFNTEQCVFTW